MQNRFGDAYKNVTGAWNDMKGAAMDAWRQAGNQHLAGSAGGALMDALGALGRTAMMGLFYGQKIDIPNIWKGSRSGLNQTVNIVLHCLHPEIDEAFKAQITEPLSILFKMAAPESSSDGGGSGSNDIITYSNPPYLDVQIDGLWHSKLCGVSAFNATADFKSQSMVKAGRPHIIKVQMTFTDMYNVIIWADEGHDYAPTPKDICDLMNDTERDSAAIDPDEIYSYHLIPEPSEEEDGAYSAGTNNFGNKFGAGQMGGGLSNIISDGASIIGKVKNTVGRFGNIISQLISMVNLASRVKLDVNKYKKRKINTKKYLTYPKAILDVYLQWNNQIETKAEYYARRRITPEVLFIEEYQYDTIPNEITAHIANQKPIVFESVLTAIGRNFKSVSLNVLPSDSMTVAFSSVRLANNTNFISTTGKVLQSDKNTIVYSSTMNAVSQGVIANAHNIVSYGSSIGTNDTPSGGIWGTNRAFSSAKNTNNASGSITAPTKKIYSSITPELTSKLKYNTLNFV